MKEATPDQMRLFRRRQGIAGVTSILLTLIWGAFFVWLVLHHKIQDWGTTFIIGCCVLMVVKLAFQFLYYGVIYIDYIYGTRYYLRPGEN
jgi:hypothetical protein